MPGGNPMGGMMGGMAAGGMGSGEGRQQRPLSEQDLKAEQLMNIVTTAVEPDSWSEVGGSGTIGQYNGLLVVSQSARTHAKIEKVLDMLREAGNLPKTKSPRVVR
jgi:general secretion pathway protein D